MHTVNTNRMIEYQNNEPTRPPVMEAPRRSPLTTIWNRILIVLACAVLGLDAAAMKYFSSTKLYTAGAQIYVETSGSRIGGPRDGAVGNVYREAEMMTKSPVLMIAKKLLADDVLAEEAKTAKPPRGAAAGAPQDPKDARDSQDAREVKALAKVKTFEGGGNPVAILQAGLRTSVGKNDDFINISFESPYPEDAANIVNAVVNAYKSFNTKQKDSSVDSFLKESEPKREMLNQELQERLDKLAKWRKENHWVAFDPEKGNPVQQRLQSLEDAWTAAKADAIAAKAEYATKAEVLVPDPAKRAALTDTGKLPGVVLSPTVDEQQLRNDLNLAQQNLEILGRRYGQNHPAIQQSLQRVEGLSGMYAIILRQHYELARNKEALAGEAHEKQKKAADEMANKMAEFQVLEATLKRTEKVLEILDSRIKAVNVGTEAPTVLDVKVVEWAKKPTEATKPQLTMLLFQGGMLGLLAGLVLALADNRLRSVGEITAAANLPVLGVVPNMNRRQTLMSRGRKVHLDPMSDVAEAYRQVRTAVFYGMPEDKAKTILVTSATRGDGKSTLASNLAIAMAEAGQHVLIVDADLREPTQHRIFSATADKGITSIVAGRATLDRAIQATAIKNLDILPCGPIPLNPAEIVNNQAFADVLDALCQRYDRIILDSPPVMPVTDARILGATCDVTILVLRAERSTRGSTADARDGLLGFGANLLGVVVNGGSRRRGKYGYYGGYGMRRGATAQHRQMEAGLNGNEMIVKR